MNKIAKIVALSIVLRMGSSVWAQDASQKDTYVDTTRVENQDDVQVTGVVIHAATGKGVLGASVWFEERSVLTDEQGSFSLSVPMGIRTSLRVSMDGFVDRMVEIHTKRLREPLEIRLFEDFFVSIRERNDLFKRSDALVLDDEIGLRMSGSVRSIRRSATSAVGSNMFIRGYQSLNANAQPLLVVDGVIWDQPAGKYSIHDGIQLSALTSLDVNDIESVEIIRDARSLYGSKGANGVLSIKTNRGREKATKIDFDMVLGMSQQPRIPSVLDAEDYRIYISELLKGSPEASALSSEFEGYLDLDPNGVDYKRYHNNTDWNELVFQNGNTQRYGLRVQGGDDMARYAISVGYTQATGTVVGTDFSRLNARINSDIDLLDRVRVASDIYFTQVERELRDDGVNERTSPSYIAQIKSPFLLGYAYTTDGKGLTNNLEIVDDFGVSNPLYLQEYARGQHNQYRFGIGVTPEWDFHPNWTLSSRFSFYIDNLKEHYFSPMDGVSPVYIEGKGTSYNTVKDQTALQSSLFNDTYVSFEKQFDRLHSLQGSMGFRVFANRYDYSVGIGHNTGGNNLFNLTTGLDFIETDGALEKWNTASLYGQVTYVYDRWVNLWSALTTDASSRFGEASSGSVSLLGGNWGFFPSVGLMLDLKQSLPQLTQEVELLRFRSSVGLSGNDDLSGIARYGYLSPVTYLGNAIGKEVGNLANQRLKWETTSKWNSGVDVGFWDGRMVLQVDVYKHVTRDLLTFQRAPLLSGLDRYLTNAGSLSNKGYEFGLQLIAYNGERFKWNAGLNVGHYKNEILELPNGDYITEAYDAELLTAVGQPASVFYGYKTKGVFASSEEAEAAGLVKQNLNGTYSRFAAGDVHFVDQGDGKTSLDGETVIDENDRTIIGNPNPDVYGTLSNTFQLGAWSMEILCTYSLGNDVYNYQRRTLESMSALHNQTAAVNNRWRYEGQVTDVPRAVYGDPLGNSRFSDRWIEDGSYMKLKNIRLHYQLPITASFLQGASVWAACSDIYTWSRYLGSDPETSVSGSVIYQGIDNGLLSAGRSFSLGVKLNL
ncbi:MAG: SusC/RagA family TonB-linked outer membrane protein [Bacteroidales bacterium]